MEKLEQNVNRFLPYGDSLSQILRHRSITKVDIRNILRSKGIFVANDDDDCTFPVALSTLFSPVEFEFLAEKLKTREERPKIITRTLEWQSSETLINAVPDSFNIQEIVRVNYPRYTIVGTPNFRMVDKNPDEIEINIKCESQDYSLSWYRSSNEFNSQITLKKITAENNKVELQIIHTSPETLDVADKVVRKLEQVFKENNHMDSTKAVVKIQYKDFNNADRIRFFLKLTAGNDIFTFNKASYVEFGPDPSENLPSDISWMQTKVQDLKVSGNDLHELHYIKNQSLHRYIEFANLGVTFTFKSHFAEGSCKLDMGFAYYPNRNAAAEFVVNIGTITLNEGFKNVNQTEIRRYLLKQFESFKNVKRNELLESIKVEG